jgi:hypothetical protein
MDESIRAAAIERLTAHKERLIAEKIEKGLAVVVSPLVVGFPGCEGAEKARRQAELRAAGETREVIFGGVGSDAVEVIFTGVPRAGRDEGVEVPKSGPCYLTVPYAPRAETKASASAPSELSPAPVVGEPRRVWVQVRPSDPERNDPGQIAEGTYTISDGMIRVEDLQGKRLGSEVLTPGADPDSLARKILREKRPGGFYDPIVYPHR